MPHTSRRKKTPHKKLHQVQGEDDWVSVVYASNASRARKAIEKNKIDDGPPRNETGVTLAELHTKLDSFRKMYRESECHISILTMVRQSFASCDDSEVKSVTSRGAAEDSLEDGVKITSALCLALGSFTRYIDLRSMWQLAFFLETARSLPHEPERVMPMSAQDPAFSALDIEFLESLNIRVLPMSDMDIIDRQTFLFVPFLDSEVEYSPLLQAAKVCPIYITSGIDSITQYLDRFEIGLDAEDSTAAKRQEARQALQTIKSTHSNFQFPAFEPSGYAFTGLRILVLKGNNT
ncbi:Lethal(2) giant larvae SRO7 [Sphaceloma murrayae]|uniref:Lethal(2) giant larvae SRO7 n=1 Tax=Sphaceloma murrayae TaxID=2082308 RepID=A0A2K1QVG2_9PEZI|nr:Lethal(2) giant larvae SRO7 [Sphaceloma murrayae]